MEDVNEKQGRDSVSLNQAEDSEEYLEEQEEDYQEVSQGSAGLGVESAVGNPVRTYSVVSSSPSTATTASQLALIQRKAAQRRLQMAKLMGNNGGMASNMNFHRVVAPQHTATAANDARQGNQKGALNVPSSRRPRSTNFTVPETFDLLKIWAVPENLWNAKYNSRGSQVWDKIAHSMNDLGYNRTTTQCRNRVQNLISAYYRIKKSKQDYRTFDFPYYKFIGNVLDGKKKMIELDAQAPGSRSAAAKTFQNLSSNPNANDVTTMSFVSRNGGSSASVVELDEDSETITVEDDSLPSEHGQDIEASDYDDSYKSGDETPSGRNGGLPGVRSVKRSFSSNFNPYEETEDTHGGGVVAGNAAKRPRVSSTATSASASSTATSASASSTQMDDDPIGQYLAVMVDIERQRLEMERESAENERVMMTYMMQILQAIVCPNQSQEEEGEGEEGGNEAENDREDTKNEFAENEQEADENEIRQMIEQEEDNENHPPNGEPEND